MHHIQLLRALAEGVFAIEEQQGALYREYAESILQGRVSNNTIVDEISKNKERTTAYLLSPDGESYKRSDSLKNIEPGSCYVLGVRGALMKESFCGSPGTVELAEDFTLAMRNPNVGSVLIIGNTPGGQVAGTFEFVDAIAALQEETGKPVLFWVDGVAASGGYAIAAACKEVWACHKTAIVGSIGVMQEVRKADDRTIRVVASTSPDKNKMFVDAEGGKPEAMQNEYLNPLHQIFKDSAKTHRPTINDEVLTGKIYLAQKAQELNMIDGICTLEQAVNRCFKLANSIN